MAKLKLPFPEQITIHNCHGLRLGRSADAGRQGGMTIEEALQWCMDNGVEIGFGRNPYDGSPSTSMRHGHITRDWDPGTPAEQIIRLVERARRDR